MSPRADTPERVRIVAGLRLLATLPPRPHEVRPAPSPAGWYCMGCGRPALQVGHFWRRRWEHEPDPEAAGFRRR